ncbi:MAG: DUF1570 domain-containing protein [Pirellulales bacterium]
MKGLVCYVAALVLACAATESSWEDKECWQVTYKTAGKSSSGKAEVIKKYGDGSALLQVPDGQLLSLFPEEIVEKQPVEAAMQALTQDEMIEQLKTQLKPDFKFLKTKHYVFAYNTSQIYADWVGQLYERFYRAFFNDWNTRGIKLQEPRFPLVAIVFRTKADYLEFAHKDIGKDADAMIGYYYINSNRVIMYDITGVDENVPTNGKISSQFVINTIKSQPDGERNVATIVHEAVHQLAYNTGLQVRLADNPRWLSEGLAMYFEAPDLNNPQGWKIGNVNYYNLRLFISYLNQRPADSIRTLIQDDQKFGDPALVSGAYSESWALTYFLMKGKKKQFTAYMKEIAELEVLAEADVRKRVEHFEKHFGDLEKLDREFLNYVRSNMR